MNQKMKSGRKVISYVLALVMVLSTLTGIVPGTSKMAYAAETWSSDQTISETQTISGGITVGADITLTINDGVTLTVNDGINADGHTLTVTGSGALIVKGARGNDGESYLDGDVGEYGTYIEETEKVFDTLRKIEEGATNKPIEIIGTKTYQELFRDNKENLKILPDKVKMFYFKNELNR